MGTRVVLEALGGDVVVVVVLVAEIWATSHASFSCSSFFTSSPTRPPSRQASRTPITRGFHLRSLAGPSSRSAWPILPPHHHRSLRLPAGRQSCTWRTLRHSTRRGGGKAVTGPDRLVSRASRISRHRHAQVLLSSWTVLRQTWNKKAVGKSSQRHPHPHPARGRHACSGRATHTEITWTKVGRFRHQGRNVSSAGLWPGTWTERRLNRSTFQNISVHSSEHFGPQFRAVQSTFQSISAQYHRGIPLFIPLLLGSPPASSHSRRFRRRQKGGLEPDTGPGCTECS